MNGKLENLISEINIEASKGNLSIEMIRSLVYAPRWNNIPPEVPPILTIGKTRILSPGNLSLLVAGAGHGKSAVCEAICCAAIAECKDVFQFKVNLRGTIFYVDTERSKQDHAKSWLKTMERARISKNSVIPKKLRFELISSLPSVNDRKKYLAEIITLPNLSLLILDGIGDFVADVNDPEASNEFLFWLLSEAKKQEFGIFATLHPNPADQDKKGRGHLGSEAMRRAESVLAIQKNGANEIRTITMDFRYGKNRSDTDAVTSSFKWSCLKRMFVSCKRPEIKPVAQQKQDMLIDKLCKTGQTDYPYMDLIRAIMKTNQISEGAAEQIHLRLKAAKKIIQDNGKWRIIKHE